MISDSQVQAPQAFRPSAQQRRLWSVQRPEDRFLTQGAFLIEGELRTDRLRQAVQQVVAAQDILRTRFVRRPGQRFPLQVVEPEGRADWGEIRPIEILDGDLRRHASFLLEQEREPGFDLASGPVLRLRLIEVGESRHLLLLFLPALCADRRGLENLVREIGRAYAGALPAGDDDEAPVQYADFAEWQEQLLAEEDEDTVAARAFWERLEADSALGELSLPEEEPRDGAEPFAPRAHPVAVGPALLERLTARAGELQASLPQLLLAAWQVLLWRLTGRETLAVGRIFSGRSHEALEDLLGLFGRCLPVTGSFDPGASFASLLGQVAEAERQALGWQEFADLDKIPTLAAVFEAVELPAPWTSDGLRFSFCAQNVCCERFKIKLCCQEEDGAARLEIHFDPALLNAPGVERLGGRLRRLLEEIAGDPGRPIGDLDLLTGEERHELL